MICVQSFMDGVTVKDEADTWGPSELGFSHKHGSDQQQKLQNQVIKDEVLTGSQNHHLSDQPHTEDQHRSKHVEEPSGFPLTIISVKTEDGDNACCVSGLEEEFNDQMEDAGELESYGNSSDTENSVSWDGELAAKISTGRESDSNLQTDDEEQAERSKDWIQKWKVSDDVCYPVHINSNKLDTDSVDDQGLTEEHRCPECGKAFTDKLYLKRHMIRHTGRRPFTCSVCKKSFTQNAHLRKHMRCHTGERPFTCPMCDASFSLKQNLHRHMTSHSGAKSFSCSVCKKGFTQKCHLRRHMSLHLREKLCTCPQDPCEHVKSVNGKIIALTPEKPYICPFCSKGFTRKDHLSSHLSAHTGDKQFDCPECDAKFNLKQSLERHMTVHSGEKPFKCPDCKKGFTRNSTLKLHMRTHTGEKPFSCSECDAKFNRKENFLRHLTVHTGERPYSCPVCKKDFVRKPSLDKHMKSHTQK
ncbi:hypothetical protein NQD34_000888 [Periophthalmus magnuspinnatus]|uniref:gastrula zinc finger protein XlCGF57.1-like n=1 Tax=Periophthalmus magnuspinnatus TaxID=409849 RepID=UPI00145C0440|nr:gastrula zinc finger protein XlCGF57.1-like [Periophthalmus magnuspinnatus]KAJ0033781.1 hypothetical protein NQD34_000888 [Periophthalmus magnuspinnatus]